MVMMVFVLTWKQLISDDNDGDDGFNWFVIKLANAIVDSTKQLTLIL